MIKYSTNPSPDAQAITKSPTSPIKTKDGQAQESDALDLDANDDNI